MEGGGIDRGQVDRIESRGRPPTPEDVWNAAIRAGADPARLALSLSHVLGVEPEGWDDEEPVEVRYTLKTGDVLTYDATYPNPFMHLRNTSLAPDGAGG